MGMPMSDQSILMVAAEAREFRGILRNCGNTERLDWPVDFAQSASWNGLRLVCVANGPGFLLAGRAVRIAGERDCFRAVVSTGFCGALDPELVTGDVLEVSRVIDVLNEVTYPCRKTTGGPVRLSRAALASIDRVAESSEEKAELRAVTAAHAVEMEAAEVARYAAGADIPFYCFRAISDTAEHSFDIHLNALRDSEGRFARKRIVWEALTVEPWRRIPGLVALDRNCRLAEDRLGEFFANCHFA
jgi:adenosylhomocysteine nucleosidase